MAALSDIAFSSAFSVIFSRPDGYLSQLHQPAFQQRDSLLSARGHPFL